MQIRSLYLRNFRNFSEIRFDLSPAFNLFIGKNAQGKTNIVESIGLLATGRSFRTSEFRDMIKWGEESADVGARADTAVGPDDLKITLGREKKLFFRNQKKTRAGGFKGMYTVLFAPEEILLLRDSPSARRDYIDTLICEITPRYGTIIGNYERVVSQRNRLLQNEEYDRQSLLRGLSVWDEKLIEFGTLVVMERALACERLNSFVPSRYGAIAPNDKRAFFRYRPHCTEEALEGGETSIARAIDEGLKKRRDDELIRRITLVGPHRDDLVAELGGNPVKNFGSQGQHRSFVLAMKISEIDIVKEVTGEMPVLLLDDVASELDRDRNRYFFEYLAGAKGQVFITGTSIEDIKISSAAANNSYMIDCGGSSTLSQKF